MLTLKVITQDGFQNVFQVKSATLNPTSETRKTQSVLYDNGTHECFPIEEGIVYVMNDEGKTVTKWELTPVYYNIGCNKPELWTGHNKD